MILHQNQKRKDLVLIKKTVVTDFIHGNAIFKLPKEKKNKLKKHINIKFINQKNFNPNSVEIYWGTRIKDNYIKKFKNLKWVHFGSVGTDNLSLKVLKNKRITITNSKSINSESVSKLILFYILDTEKRILSTGNFSNRKKFEQNFLLGNETYSHKILILGYGSIAKQLQKILKKFKFKFDIYSSRANIIKYKNIVSYKKIINNLDKYNTVINLLKFNSINKKFMNKTFFNKLNKKINLILVGRIQTIDLNQLYNFLNLNKKSFCYLDAKSDINNLEKIRKLKNIFISPHIGGYYAKYWDDQFDLFKSNLLRYLNGKKLKNIVKINQSNFK